MIIYSIADFHFCSCFKCCYENSKILQTLDQRCFLSTTYDKHCKDFGKNKQILVVLKITFRETISHENVYYDFETLIVSAAYTRILLSIT